MVENYWLPEPFQFADDENGQGPVGKEGLMEAFKILTLPPRTVFDAALRGLLADELNELAGYVSSLRIDFQSLIAWQTEYVLASEKVPDREDLLKELACILWMLNMERL